MSGRADDTRSRAILAAVALLGGCASFSEGDCVRFEQLRREMRSETRYVYVEAETGKRLRQFEPLAPAARAAAPLYTLAIDRSETRPCSHLLLKKALFLQRTAGKDLVFEEVREFYAEHGMRIAEKRENLTAQLATSGYYTAEVPLPIPPKAPPGRYQIVSKLLLKQGGRPQTILAQTRATFRVLPPKPK